MHLYNNLFIGELSDLKIFCQKIKLKKFICFWFIVKNK